MKDPSINLPGKAQSNHPDTAKAAAAAQVRRSGTLRMRVLRAIAQSPDGLADYEIASTLDALHYSCAPRRVELVEMGWVEDSGRRRKTTNGTDAVVWQLTAGARERGGATEDAIRPTKKDKVDWKAKYERLQKAALAYAGGDSRQNLDELLDAADVPREGAPL